MPRDLSGLSIKNPRVRVVHTTDPALEGGSMYLQQVDPWLGYQWGRSLTQRNFRERDGVYGDAGKIDGILLPDGVTKMMDRGHTNSCGACHNVPYRDAGAGMTIAKNGGAGRNTPHMFGGGLVEMIGLQMRLQALAIADTNRDGWISFEEAQGQTLRHRQPARRASTASASRSTSAASTTRRRRLSRPQPDLLSRSSWTRTASASPSARNLKFPDVAGYTIRGAGLRLRPPVHAVPPAGLDDAARLHGDAVRHPLRPAGPRPDDATPTPPATAWPWSPTPAPSSS